ALRCELAYGGVSRLEPQLACRPARSRPRVANACRRLPRRRRGHHRLPGKAYAQVQREKGMTRDAGDIARLSAAALWADDRASQGLGMEMVSGGRGRAELAVLGTGRMVKSAGFA